MRLRDGRRTRGERPWKRSLTAASRPRCSCGGRAPRVCGVSTSATSGVPRWLSGRDEEDRDFIARCITTEGPSHHRLASVALVRLLARAREAAGGPIEAELDGVPVRFRLPPHLDRHADAEAHYPIHLPRRALDQLAPAGSREAEAFADADRRAGAPRARQRRHGEHARSAHRAAFEEGQHVSLPASAPAAFRLAAGKRGLCSAARLFVDVRRPASRPPSCMLPRGPCVCVRRTARRRRSAGSSREVPSLTS
jgi:hypothetical protein